MKNVTGNLALLLLGLSSACGTQAPAGSVATVPLVVEGNRPYVGITFERPDGSTRTARFVVDSGGGGFVILEKLARELGLEWGPPRRENGMEFGMATTTPTASIGDLALPLVLGRVVVVLGRDDLLPDAAPGASEGLLPGHILAQHHVIFDYPNGTFTIARPGVLTPVGERMDMPVATQSGFPRTELTVDGRTYGFLIDTGASFTMVSQALLETWGSAHPDWRRYPGAFGDAATLGGQTLETMFVPSASWGAMELTEMGVTSQSEGTFEEYMSRSMTAPIVGSLAGNVLTHFRVELDYANQALYLTGPQ